MKIFRIIIIGIALLFSSSIFAQYENTSGQNKSEKKVHKTPSLNKWFAGGMIGGGFSTYNSYLEVSPIIGYHITPAFDLGTRITYIFQSYKDIYGQTHNNHSYGGSLFARYRFLKFLMIHVEYAGLSNKWYDGNRYWVNSLYIGGGLYQSIGGAGFATITILYDVFEDPYSPYNNPLIRIGFGVGF